LTSFFCKINNFEKKPSKKSRLEFGFNIFFGEYCNKTNFFEEIEFITEDTKAKHSNITTIYRDS